VKASEEDLETLWVGSVCYLVGGISRWSSKINKMTHTCPFGNFVYSLAVIWMMWRKHGVFVSWRHLVLFWEGKCFCLHGIARE
jgi:hypothetical protein